MDHLKLYKTLTNSIRVPFYVMGALLLLLWGLLWVWFLTNQTGPTGSLVAHFRAVGVQAALWFVLTAYCLQVMAFMGISSYLAAYLMHTYRLSAGATALPLVVAGCGVIGGSLVGAASLARPAVCPWWHWPLWGVGAERP